MSFDGMTLSDVFRFNTKRTGALISEIISAQLLYVLEFLLHN